MTQIWNTGEGGLTVLGVLRELAGEEAVKRYVSAAARMIPSNSVNAFPRYESYRMIY